MTYQFTIQVKGYKNPEVWRRIETPANFTFYQFQKAIEIAFRKEATTLLYTFSPLCIALLIRLVAASPANTLLSLLHKH